MKRFLKLITVIFGLLSLLVLCLTAFIPIQKEKMPVTVREESDNGLSVDAPITEEASADKMIAPERIASLFGWVRPIIVPKQVNPEPEPEPEPDLVPEPPVIATPVPEPVAANWLFIVGEITTEGQNKTYFLKNTKSGKVIKIDYISDAGQDWKILADENTRLVVENEGMRYFIPKR